MNDSTPTEARLRPPRRRRRRHPSVARALEFMHENLRLPISLEEIAAAAGLSQWHLARVFRRAVGLPPYAYLRQLRVERAMRLLEDERLPIAAIADEVGFCDQSHLNRRFKARVGCTPAQYRRAFAPSA